MNYFLDNPDLVETFDRLVPWDRIVPVTQGAGADVADSVATWREMLAVAGEYIGTEIAGRAKQVDELGVIRDGGRIETSEPMKANLRGLADLGLVGLSLSESYEGSGLPQTVNSFGVEMIARACSATMVEFGIGYTEPAAMILRFGSDDQKRRWVPRLVRGEVKGAVAMTEPQAGSDVGNIQTVARVDGDSWRLTGRKQFISAGNGEFVIVLARAVKDSKGLDGLALFLVDRDGDNYMVERAEHKFPIRGSSTCSLVFDGSRAELLGEVGAGWREILTFMNESRIAIGLQGLGIGEAAYAKAMKYATERGRTVARRPDAAAGPRERRRRLRGRALDVRRRTPRDGRVTRPAWRPLASARQTTADRGGARAVPAPRGTHHRDARASARRARARRAGDARAIPAAPRGPRGAPGEAGRRAQRRGDGRRRRRRLRADRGVARRDRAAVTKAPPTPREEEILAAAARIFREKGYHGAS